MPELHFEKPPHRDQVLDRVETRLHEVVPGFRALASDLGAERSRIDLFGADESGRGVVVALSEHEDEALLAFSRVLAQRAYADERLEDWRKLSPGLPVRPDLPVLGVVLSPAFGPEVRAAAASVAPCPIRLVTWSWVAGPDGADLLLDTGRAGPEALLEPSLRGRGKAPAAEPASAFRTGLSDDELGLSDAERAEFD